MLGRAVLVPTLAVACLGLLSCAASEHSNGDQSRPTPDPSSAFATTPENAAVGFDRSVRSHAPGSRLRFQCLPGNEYEFSSFGEDVQGTPSASAVRSGGAWVVTLMYAPQGVSSRYQVSGRSGG